MENEDGSPGIIQTESMKLSRGMKGNYSWEIKLLRGDEESEQEFFNRIVAMNTMYVTEYGAIAE